MKLYKQHQISSGPRCIKNGRLVVGTPYDDDMGVCLCLVVTHFYTPLTVSLFSFISLCCFASILISSSSPVKLSSIYIYVGPDLFHSLYTYTCPCFIHTSHLINTSHLLVLHTTTKCPLQLELRSRRRSRLIYLSLFSHLISQSLVLATHKRVTIFWMDRFYLIRWLVCCRGRVVGKKQFFISIFPQSFIYIR